MMGAGPRGLRGNGGAGRVWAVMSATEVIEMIKKLSPEEQAQVREFVRKADSSQPAPPDQRSVDERGIAVGRAFIERHPELFRKLAQ